MDLNTSYDGSNGFLPQFGNSAIDKILRDISIYGKSTVNNPIGSIKSIWDIFGGNKSGTDKNQLMNILLPILAGVSGGLEGRSTRSTPFLDPKIQGLQGGAIDAYSRLLNEDPNLKGYETSGIDDLNRSATSQARNIEETNAAHGISGPAVATALNFNDANRYSAINKFRQSIPLLSRSLREGTANAAGSFVNSSPRGVEQSGNVLGGAFGGASEILALLYGLGKI